MELCACPECGAPAEVISAESLTVAAALMDQASPLPPAGGEQRAGPERPEIVGVRCVRRHWFLGLRDRLVA